jgi:RNA polymerase sigma factor (sigma-70 family)
MAAHELIPHLFRTEYQKITAVLCRLFGIEHIEIAEDITSDAFLQAAETWGLHGMPENPAAWLYTVAKNKARNYFRHDAVFKEKIAKQLKHALPDTGEIEIDLSPANIRDSQLQMMFAVCHPSIPVEAQIGLALRILCGFGLDEIASAFLANRETISKRLTRAREKLRSANIRIELPDEEAIHSRLETVLTTLYLLFNEGYCSQGQDMILRKDLCLEAMRLTRLLVENKLTCTPPVNALLSLMCFHASRFEARIDMNGNAVLYDDQDRGLWNKELIDKGKYFLKQASEGKIISKYHIEACIAYWHTEKNDTKKKWESILQLYNQLLLVEYSPIAALNRTYALSKTDGKEAAIAAAEKLDLSSHHLYHTLLGNLYTGIDYEKAIWHLKEALALVKSASDKKTILKQIAACGQ